MASKRRGAPSSIAQTYTVAPDDAGIAGAQWVDPIERIVSPGTAEAVLQWAWGGDLSQWANLCNSMADTWPRLGDNLRTVENAIVGAPFEFQPATDPAGNVTASAQEKADLVARAFAEMRPDTSRGELGRDGVLKRLARGSIQGHAVLELLWESRDVDGVPMVMPRCAVPVSAKWYGYPNASTALKFRGPNLRWQPFPENKFLVHVVSANDAHPSQGARMRTLVKHWSGTTNGWKWLVQFAQRFGTPFRWLTYRDSRVKSKALEMLGSLGTSGYGAFPEGTKLELHESGKNAADLPQIEVMRIADEACDLVIKGETASSGTKGNQGLGNTGAVYAGVRREAMQGYCNDAVTTLQEFARMIVRLNWGDESEVPKVVCEIPDPEDALKLAQRDEVLHRMGVPLPMPYILERHDVPAAAEGEETLAPVVKAAPVAPQEVEAAKARVTQGKLEEIIELMLVNALKDGIEATPKEVREAGKEAA